MVLGMGLGIAIKSLKSANEVNSKGPIIEILDEELSNEIAPPEDHVGSSNRVQRELTMSR